MTHHDSNAVKHAAARANHLAHSAIDEAKVRLEKLSEEAKVRGEAFLEEVKDRGGDLLKEARGRGRKAARGAGEWIGENPAQAVGIAFVAGMIVRGLLSRREED